MTMSNRNFGIEIECCGLEMSVAARLITAAGVPCGIESYGHSTPRNWKIVSDGSVHDNDTGLTFELVSPILSGESGLEQVRKVSAVLLANGVTVNKTCGFHVHVNARDLAGADLINVVKRYAEHESQIDAFMPKSRRANNNRFCKSMRNVADNLSTPRFSSFTPQRLVEETLGRGHDNRYYKVNLQAFTRHGSIEFRQHSGTIEAKKMESWIQFCTNFVEASKVTVTTITATPAIAPAVVLRANAIEHKFAILAELLENSDRYAVTSYGVLAQRLECPLSAVAGYISRFKVRYGVIIKVRRNRGYYYSTDYSQRLTDIVRGGPAPVVTRTVTLPEEHGIFHGLPVEVVSYFHERSQDLSEEQREHARMVRHAAREQARNEARMAREAARAGTVANSVTTVIQSPIEAPVAQPSRLSDEAIAAFLQSRVVAFNTNVMFNIDQNA